MLFDRMTFGTKALFAFVVFSIPFAVLGAKDAARESLKIQRAVEANEFTVKIGSSTAHIFEPEVDSGHGTGFIVSIEKNEAYIFTNRHVVEKKSFEAREVKVEFNTQEGLNDKIDGEVVYISRFHDFAVVKVNLKDLTRGKNRIKVAPLPTTQEFFDATKNGSETMAYGNPLIGENISSFGEVIGRTFGKDWGISENRFWGEEGQLIIQTPLNPGNSGGPLISVTNGKVLGINTAKQVGADSFNYVTPILPLIEEWQRAKNDPLFGRKYFFPVNLREMEVVSLDHDGVKKLLKKNVPNFFDFYEFVFVVEETQNVNPLKTGDYIVRIEGEPIGNNFEKLRWFVQASKDGNLSVDVIRAGKLVNLSVPLVSLSKDMENRDNEFAMVAGMLIQDLAADEKFWTGHDGVIVTKILNDKSSQIAVNIPESSIISEVHINGKPTKIRNLKDFKATISKLPRGKFVKFKVNKPVQIEVNDRDITVTRGGAPQFHRYESLEWVPAVDFLTDQKFSVKKFSEQFDFSGTDPDSIDWRNFVKGSNTKQGRKTCSVFLSKMNPSRAKLSSQQISMGRKLSVDASGNLKFIEAK